MPIKSTCFLGYLFSSELAFDNSLEFVIFLRFMTAFLYALWAFLVTVFHIPMGEFIFYIPVSIGDSVFLAFEGYFFLHFIYCMVI